MCVFEEERPSEKRAQSIKVRRISNGQSAVLAASCTATKSERKECRKAECKIKPNEV